MPTGENPREEAAPIAAGSDRVVSLDALRGFTMFWIIGAGGLAHALDASSGGTGLLHAVAAQLKHVQWAGFTLYDFIFPTFVFVVGVSIVFSLSRHAQTGSLHAHWRVFRRFLLLFGLGLFYYGGFSNHWPGIRIMGVLQRIAICYLFASLLFMHLNLRGLIVSCVVILLGYWAFLSFVPVPGTGNPSFEESNNWAVYVDRNYLPGRKVANEQGTWDPEGIVSSVPAVATCLLGIFAGMLLMAPTLSPNRKWLYLVGAGAAGFAIGYAWGFQFPIIKKLWTSSYVLLAGGFSAMLLGFFYLIVDIVKFRAWAIPFLWIGSNALAIYMATNIFEFKELAKRFVGGDVQDALGAYGALVLALTSLTLVLVFARFLYKKRIFIRV